MWVCYLKPNCWGCWTPIYRSPARPPTNGGGGPDAELGVDEKGQLYTSGIREKTTCLHLRDRVPRYFTDTSPEDQSCLFVKRAYRGKSCNKPP